MANGEFLTVAALLNHRYAYGACLWELNALFPGIMYMIPRSFLSGASTSAV